MNMRLQLAKWGNSLAIRLPAGYTRQSGLASGDYLEAVIEPNGELRLTPDAPRADKAVVLRKLAALHKALPRTRGVMDMLRDEARY